MAELGFLKKTMHQKQKTKTKRKCLVPELHGEEEKERSDISYQDLRWN